MGLIGTIGGKVVGAALGKKSKDPQTGATTRTTRLDGPVDELVQKLLAVGVDGLGPFPGAAAVAAKALEGRTPDKAVARIVADHRKIAGAGGFVTGLGGFVTMIAALPANVVEFYIVATRMVAAVAKVRGYDIDKPETRAAILLTLVGADTDDELLRKAGVVTSGRLAGVATEHLPASAVMMINKGVGFRLISSLGEKGLTKVVGKGLPVVGGVVGGGMDYYLLGKIADNATTQFPPAAAVASR